MDGARYLGCGTGGKLLPNFDLKLGSLEKKLEKDIGKLLFGKTTEKKLDGLKG
jgi:hypothetical protein